MKKLNLLLLLVAFNSSAFDSCPTPNKDVPVMKETQVAVCHNGWLSFYDYQYKIPTYSYFKVQATNTKQVDTIKIPRKDAFRQDSDVDETQEASTKDYNSSGYDLGHIVAYEDLAWSQDSAHNSFLLTNIAPQTPHLNRDTWRVLENHVRKLSDQTDVDVNVYNIPGNTSIGNKVNVPETMIKCYNSNVETKCIAFKQDGSSTELTNDQVESMIK